MNTFDLVDIYLFNYTSTKFPNPQYGCSSMIEEMNEVRKKLKTSTLEDTLRACICNRGGHQYCISNDAIEEALAMLTNDIKSNNTKFILKNKELISTFKNFEELFLHIKNLLAPINGIGPLTIYDTAKRLGHILEVPIYPKDYVYLNAGAAIGACALLNVNKVNEFEPTSKFTPYFGTLPSIFIEDLLCMFHKKLANGLQNCP